MRKADGGREDALRRRCAELHAAAAGDQRARHHGKLLLCGAQPS